MLVPVTGEGDPFADIDVHPAAELFPLIEGAEFDDLVADIAEYGQREKIAITPDRKILDGRNRYRACRRAGVVPETRVEHSEPWAYVVSANLHRRHLTNGQRSMIGEEWATRRQGGPQGPMIKNERSYDLLGQPRDKPPTLAEAAALVGVGESSLKRAREVKAHGTDELVHAVKAGAIPVATAARVAIDLDDQGQREYVRRVDNGAHPVKLASTLDVSSRYKDDEPATPATPRNQWTADRHRTVNVAALRSLSDSLGALGLLLDSTPDGLDPSLTPTEAARWADDLRKGRRALNRVVDMLNNRKESTP